MDSWLHIPVASQYSFNKTQTLFCVPQSPPCSEPACLFKSQHTSPWSCTPARLALSPLPGSFLSFLWAFSLAVPSVWNTVPAIYVGWEQLILITQGSPQMSLLQRSHPGIQAISRLETTFFVPLYSHSPICFHRPCGSLKSIHLFTCYRFYCLLLSFTYLLSPFQGPCILCYG